MSALPLLKSNRSPKMQNGIVHLGVGAFFRAHGAVYIANSMNHCDPEWGVLGVSLRRPDQRDKLKPQGFSYTALELSRQDKRAQTIDVIADILVAPEDPKAVVDAMAQASISLVTLTITEKGYCYRAASGELDFDHADIIHDLNNIEKPKSAIGFIVASLANRKTKGLRPFTVLSCDNLPENGKLIQRVVLQFAERIDNDLARWIENETKFPCSMVDRIVPATTAADIALVETLTGFHDASPVVHEPFCQWVIEDSFVDNKRPPLERVGVQIVDDVAPYETMKLRCLNGTHSALAYLGYLAGYETISSAVSDPLIKRFIEHLWSEEIVPTIEPPKDVNLQEYCSALMGRYENAAIQHRTWQIAMDGSQKLPQRILATIRTNLLENRSVSGLCLAVAAWMVYTRGSGLEGQPIDVKDPMVDRFQTISAEHSLSNDVVDAYLALHEIFDADLSMNIQFRDTVLSCYNALIDGDVTDAIDGVLT